MTSRTASLAMLATCIAACRPSESRTAGERTSTRAIAQPAAVAQTQDTGFRGTVARVQRVRSIPAGAARPVLRIVTAKPGPSAGYDRVVFEFTGDSVPGFTVEYATKPVQRCGSGDPVTVAGTGRLVVRFEPAQAHDASGSLAAAERHHTPGLPAVRELTLVCDFEGQVAWLLGVAAPSAYRVSELTRPPRLVLDVSHPH